MPMVDDQKDEEMNQEAKQEYSDLIHLYLR